jgi:hypothetical protein
MKMASLAEIRARIQAQETKSQNNKQNSQTDNLIYPHWNIPEASVATVRFLPDGNPQNTFFWAERQLIRLPFNGVKGDTAVKRVVVQVPCMEMYGESCPVLTEVRPWYKDDSLKEMANKYWKKRTYLFQGFVRQNPLTDDKSPENPIRKFIISPQIFTVIKSSLMDPEMEELPTDYMRGLDFNIKKTSKGGYAEYSTSNWARKESALTEYEQEAIKSYGLFDLSEFLPKKPSEVELNIIKEMFEASVDGKPYDLDSWGQYYKPYGVRAGSSSKTDDNDMSMDEENVPSNTNSKPAVEQPAVASEPVKVPQNTGSVNAQDILQMIRERQKTK